MDKSYQSIPPGHLRGQPVLSSSYSAEQSISIGNLLQGVWRRKLLILCTFVLVMTGVIVSLALTSPRYTPELRILIENNENQFTQSQADANQRNTVDESEVASQVQVLLSSDLARKVAHDLNLSQYPEFNPPASGPSLFTSLFTLFGIDNEPTTQSTEQNILETYYEKLNVYPVQKSRVIVVEFTADEAKLAAQIANAIGETYVLATRQVKFDAAKAAMTWLSGEIGRLRQIVAVSEAAVEEFRARKSLFKSETTTLNAQELAGINAQIILASAARSEAQARSRAIREMVTKRGGVDASSDVLKSTVIQRLVEQQATLQRTFADQASIYLPSHPRMKSLAAEINKLSGQIRAEALKIVDSLEGEARVQGAREAELRASLAKLKAKASTGNQDEIALRALEREAEANRSLLQTFMQRFTEASARQDIASLPAGARIISRAQVLGKPTFPKTKPLFLMGLAGAVIIAFLISFIAEVFSSSTAAFLPGAMQARSEPGFEPSLPDVQAVARAAPVKPVQPIPPRQPPKVAAPPVAAVVTPAAVPVSELGPVLEELEPLMSGDTDLADASAVCIIDPVGDFALAIRRVYQKIKQAGQAAGAKRFVWTCGEDLDDKMAVLVNLSRVFAQNGNKTIVVGTDFESDELAEAFKLQGRVGLSELLTGRAKFADAIVRDSASGVHVLVQGNNLAQAQPLLASERMDHILDALDRTYEVVLLDVGPMDEAAAQVIASKASYAVVFAEATKSGKRAGAEAKQVLGTLGVANSAAVTVQRTGMLSRFLSKYRKAA